MDLNQFMLALRARRKAFAIALLTTIVTAVAVALIVPKTSALRRSCWTRAMNRR